MRRRFAAAFAEEMARRKRARKIMTYDDVLLRLRQTLRDPVRGPHARKRLRERYEVVLVDEFQDTDPVQWEIMERAFGDRSTTLVLIGDPKQAIYAFRGADVQAYLQAKHEVSAEWTLGENWRSDKPLLEAYDALFANARLGHPDIAYRHIEAAPPNVEPRLVGVPVTAPLRVRMVHVADGLVETGAKGLLVTADARTVIAADLAGAGGRAVVGRGRGHHPPPRRDRRRRGGAAPGPHRRARALQHARAGRARRAARGGGAGGHRRRRVGLRLRACPPVAPAPRGARAADVA